MELFFSSADPPFKGYYPGEMRQGKWDIYLPEKEVTLCFDPREKNPGGILEIREGILEFIRLWLKVFSDRPCMLNISGQDAYAPLLAAAGDGGRYLRSIAEAIGLRVLVE